MSKYFTIAVICLTFLSFTGYSQVQTSNPYSKIGLGFLEQESNISNPGMGGTSTWINNRNSLNISNPAALSALDTLSFVLEIGVKSRFSHMTIPGASKNSSNTNLGYFAFGFRGSKYWTAGVGLTPLSSIGYKILDKEEVANLGAIDKYYLGSGGINALYITNAFDITKNLAAAISVRHLFGKLEETNTLILQSLPNSYNTQQGIKDQVSDFDYKIGLQYHLNQNENSRYSFGLVISPQTKIQGKRSSIKGTTRGSNLWSTDDNVFIDIIEADTNKTISYDKPLSITLGAGKTVFNKHSLGFEYHFENWQSTNYQNVKNSHRISAGMSIIPQWNSATKYFKRTTYKFGAFFETTNIRVNNTDINQLGIAGGITMPIKRGIYSLDLDMQLGQMGTNRNNQIKDYYGRLSIKLRFSEIWFYKPKYD